MSIGEQKQVLLTGASGFIGRHLLKGLLDEGHTVFAPVREGAEQKIESLAKSDRLIVIEGSFNETKILNSIKSKIDVIIHAAAIRGAGKARKQEYYRINTEGTRTLVDFSLRRAIPRFLYLSTVGVSGTIPQQLPAKRDDPVAPDGEYHQSKWEAEKIVNNAPRDVLKKLILRPTITYGEGDDGFVPRLVGLIKQGKLFLPRKELFIHLLDVRALVRLIVQILKEDRFNDRTYIVADSEPVELHQLSDLIVKRAQGRYYRLPEFVFAAGSMVFSLLGRVDLKTSLLLIGKSWYYDIRPTINDLNYEPVNTLTRITEYLNLAGENADEK
ncbi:MAG: NAD-dependent epimerase/dehydratase family protein [Calditrichaeota bacterium]|nr:NAD-dependent epimerase/dehydratase family protein [Calditrichota bacterium]